MIEIRFHKSTSKNYKEVLKHCRRFLDFEEGEPNVLRIPDAETLYSQWDDFNLIIHNAKRWSGCTVLYYNKPLIPYRVLSDWFYSIQSLKYCYFTFYKKTADKANYCNDGGVWGCKMLNSIERYILHSFWPRNYWYNYGRFVSENEWKINKEQIRAVLLEEAEHKCLNFCPAFTKQMIEPHLAKLPDRLTVDDVNWKIRYITDYLENGPVEIPNGVEHTDKEEYISKGEVLFDPPQREVDLNNLSDEEANRIISEYLNRRKDK